MLRLLSVSRVRFALVLGLALIGGLAGCKGGVGDRCQISDDCAGDLVCAPSTDTCVESVNAQDAGGIDAAIDASDPDATDPDAMPIDAPIDAAIDAPPGPPGP